jgi:hypothetical protein
MNKVQKLINSEENVVFAVNLSDEVYLKIKLSPYVINTWVGTINHNFFSTATGIAF